MIFFLNQTAVLMTYGYNYIGASGEINVWNPRVEKLPEFTTAQIWLKNGEVNNFESVEAGWTVSSSTNRIVETSSSFSYRVNGPYSALYVTNFFSRYTLQNIVMHGLDFLCTGL